MESTAAKEGPVKTSSVACGSGSSVIATPAQHKGGNNDAVSTIVGIKKRKRF
jgi:hypothetical protein